ncbi:hypothetical protein DYB25_003064 [Aphanomyces astaci]|uniref:DUF924 domain-containing protein n=1 Tax=Aphanomyces astaci TaxID=112090 RepID=A0A397DSZ0_APHAT|nr:hypothetical protein DYB25_003064 [Aphanomyces astaci]RHY13389.1 hypothetical protein DYB36_000872 [Aphanomyces astaci]RHY40051.1 hypothetical protein DYB34_002285 [Aphanomyces astaci]RHY49549.1 hypothetical protein DYB38_005999 [Aphanomyces astaci]RHY67665.1 hypothetical protein DYB30_003283 [Aphanomyces astaci]
MAAAVHARLQSQAKSILQYWFGSTYPQSIEMRQMWFKKDAAIDDAIRDQYGALVSDAQVKLAAVLCLDQFTRNIYRDQATAFHGDRLAQAFVEETVGSPVAMREIKQLHALEQGFFFMPLMHSEDKRVHVVAERVFNDLSADFAANPALNGTTAYFAKFEHDHKAIIDRFGRYPHRNAILGRESTPEEIEFLRQPNSSF